MNWYNINYHLFAAISIQVQKVIQALEDSDDPMVTPTHSMKLEPNMSGSPDTIEVIVRFQ